MLEKIKVGWVACDYTQGNNIQNVRHGEIHDSLDVASTDAWWGKFDGVRWVEPDGHLYVDAPEKYFDPNKYE